MMTPLARRLESIRGWIVAALLSLIPLPLWVLAHQLPEAFVTPTKAMNIVANLTALVGTATLAVTLVVGTRWPSIERLFGGLDRMYRAHRHLALAAITLVTAHALFLAAGRLLVPGPSPWTLFTPRAGWRVFLGVVALAGLIGGVVVTLFARLQHQTFIRVQRALAIVFVLASVHVFVVSGTKASSRPLTVYLGALTAAALVSFVRRSLLPRLLVRRHRYRVERVDRLDDETVEATLVPLGVPMEFRPGQFAFVSFADAPGGPEAHPFSMASPSHDSQLRFVIKALGDHTAALMDLEPGGVVAVEGPYGSFSHRDVDNPRQIWIAGGIAITSFLSMARSLNASGHEIDLYYCTEHAEQAHFLDELFEIADRDPRFRVIPIRKTDLGHVRAEDILGVSVDLSQQDIFVSGPPAMIQSLDRQFRDIGIPQARIHFENLRLMP
jgi:predicted ferric reductase